MGNLILVDIKEEGRKEEKEKAGGYKHLLKPNLLQRWAVSNRSPGEGNGNPLQYSCLENLMDREV